MKKRKHNKNEIVITVCGVPLSDITSVSYTNIVEMSLILMARNRVDKDIN